MIVTKDADFLFDHLLTQKIFSFDCETTGLRWQKGDYAFMWSFATAEEQFVIDLREVEHSRFYERFHQVLGNPEVCMVGAGSKFDLHMSKITKYAAKVYDVQILARLFDSRLLSLSLKSLAPMVKMGKEDEIKKWIKKNKAYKYRKDILGNLIKDPRYDVVPPEIIYPYAASDAEITLALYTKLMKDLEELDLYNKSLPGGNGKSIFKVLETEVELTRVLFQMEKRGVLIDESYTRDALSFERSEASKASSEFKRLTGRDLVDSAKLYAEIFGATPGVLDAAPRTKTGAYSFTDAFLSSMESDVAKTITLYRGASKKSGTYYANFLELSSESEEGKRIHTNFRQAKTATGRLSSAEPNLQNVSNDDDGQYKIRRCLIAPKDYYVVSLDYKAQEMRVLFDLAGEMALISAVKGGADVHQATADEVGSSRSAAKTINFGIVYGMGINKLAEALKVLAEEARLMRNKYFRKLPFVSRLIGKIKERASKGCISNVDGRIYKFDPRFAYKAVNYLIQGSSSGIVKRAMIKVERLLESYRSKLILQVHDELVCYIHKDELETLVPLIKELMISSYKQDYLPMDVGVEIGLNYNDLEDYSTWLQKQKQPSRTEQSEISTALETLGT